MLDSYPITLDGVTFAWNGITELTSEDETSLIATNLDGWLGAPSRKTVHTERPGADGVFRGDAYRGARVIQLDGNYYAPDGPRLRTLERKLAAICSDPRKLYPLVVADELNPLTSYVELAGDVKLAPLSSDRGVFSLSLIAPDPRRFGPWTTASVGAFSGGTGGVVSAAPGVVSTAPGVDAGTAPTPTTITVANPSTGPALLVVQFTGPVTNPSVLKTGDGSQVLFSGSLNSGEDLWVNLSTQPAHEVPGMPSETYLHGRSLYGPGGYAGGGGLTVVNGKWPTLLAGETATFLISGGAPGSVHMRPTYW